MATKYIRIGSAENMFAYDDADYDSAMETDAPIKSGAPIDSDDVLRKGDAVGGGQTVTAGFAYFCGSF
jgi:hypothetical protein